MRRVKRTITGEGANFNDALSNAIAQAQRENRVPDGTVEWTVKSIKGTSGGLLPRTRVQVELDAEYLGR